MDTNVLDWLEVTAAACPDKPAFLDEDGAVTFADVRREARIIGTAAAKLRSGRKAPIAVMSGRNAHQSILRTYERRPDLLEKSNLTEKEKKWLKDQIND